MNETYGTIKVSKSNFEMTRKSQKSFMIPKRSKLVVLLNICHLLSG